MRLLAALALLAAGARAPRPRVYKGVDDALNEFPYVVSLESEASKVGLYRRCTGTLLAPEWVLTAGHCIHPKVNLVRYGNMTIPRNATNSISRIIKSIRHPAYSHQNPAPFYRMVNDIGLLLIEKIPIPLGALSAVDYSTLMGLRVRYAGYGMTFVVGEVDSEYIKIEDERRGLQLGEGVVVPCSREVASAARPIVCLGAPCARRDHTGLSGDSGGPLVFDGKVVAVFTGVAYIVNKEIEGFYTPVSPFLSWISKTMTSNNRY